jgi:virulence-associated protein VapD
MATAQKTKLSPSIFKHLSGLKAKPNTGDTPETGQSAIGDSKKTSLLNNLREETKIVYAIAFDLDTTTLQKAYHVAAYNNAYADIRNRLVTNHGFAWQQGSVYFGGDTVNAVTCVVAVIDLTNTFPWFAASVRDIRMLRIEEQNDLAPAINQALMTQQPKTQ